MSYSNFRATSKQFSYYRSLTGCSLPPGCSKSKASGLIARALKGERPAPPKVIVNVYGWKFDALTLRVMKPEMDVTKYAVDVDYRSVRSDFATAAEAEAFARARYPDAEITVGGFRTVLMD